MQKIILHHHLFLFHPVLTSGILYSTLIVLVKLPTSLQYHILYRVSFKKFTIV
jgi:hypothetical protein